ncbi:unnamed protein product [Ilex paraguariensis]|uniref:NAC domain-containing protein n=1 Tax=Ilex paraguariensis TaxID=185542 RepID=A0ABC8T0Y5_9AQUA
MTIDIQVFFAFNSMNNGPACFYAVEGVVIKSVPWAHNKIKVAPATEPRALKVVSSSSVFHIRHAVGVPEQIRLMVIWTSLSSIKFWTGMEADGLLWFLHSQGSFLGLMLGSRKAEIRVIRRRFTMTQSWLIDSRGLARKVKNATLPSASQIKDCGANRECPNCHYRIDNRDVSQEWPGLPAGVKFDPSDVELLEHLAAKCGVGNLKPHMFIDEFIPTLTDAEGICSTHPENLPGARKDGSSVHFFYKIINAYASGQRKRRKIHDQHGTIKEHVRWHKTGKTKLVMENGVQKGCKKIMVLYRTSKKGSKPDKSNWVMHQYHLGIDEDEKEGQYVVSKICYQQQKQTDKDDNSLVVEEPDMGTIRTSPRTPKTTTPNPPRNGKSVSRDDVTDDYILQSPAQSTLNYKTLAFNTLVDATFVSFPLQLYLDPTEELAFCHSDNEEAEFVTEISHHSSSPALINDDMEYPTCLAGESQDVDIVGADDSLLCNEVLDYNALTDLGLNHGPFTGFARNTNDVPEGEGNANYNIADLENLELDTPLDCHLTDLQFGSQDSILDWLDWL